MQSYVHIKQPLMEVTTTYYLHDQDGKPAELRGRERLISGRERFRGYG